MPEFKQEAARLVQNARTRAAHGGPRFWRKLIARGIPVGNNRVQRLTQLHGIRAKGKRCFKLTTDSNRKLPISPNPLNPLNPLNPPNPEFALDEPDKV